MRGVLILALLLMGGIWSWSYFQAEARMRRATARLVKLVQKDHAESPVALGLAANRLGKELAPGSTLEWNEYGPIASSRQEIVQLFAQVRSLSARIVLDESRIAAATTRRGEVMVRVEARYNLEAESGGSEQGKGMALLAWRKGEDGWRIEQAHITTETNRRWPDGGL